ncbi:L-threonylcarbamoyladenylate synthase [Pontibacter aydingkolensis]|uniref:Threonylcarbamoyl-AMP synthase n=1 Tax=Pontibacter aydingkolensis TaxID=1911536 RepID=A0ABS7CSK3_9BACT|nr:L-threonylcarbamoyladenylate synthase [Pontibacter aydingkolensis]MBW7466681.1 threonylcarbamoyl-AMP synthase [Pontibacter aydingkolensis]
MAITGLNYKRAGRFLAGGRLVAIPTETVYGLAANALDESAVEQIFTTKGRPHYNPLIIHIGSKNDLNKYVTAVPEMAQRLIEAFWPGPLTLLLPKKEIVPDLITASLPRVAVRMPNHPLTLKLLQLLDFPLAAPSANPFCYISPTRAEHVQQQIGDKIPYILDGGPCEQGLESTIVGFEEGTPVVYRLGAITPEEIKAVAGQVKMHQKSSEQLEGPGMLPFHYSPRTPLYFTNNVDELLKVSDPAKTGVISFQRAIEGLPEKNQVVLSAAGYMQEAASKLYDSLHYLDGLNLSRIIAEKLPEYGLGMTINERLRKAAGKTTESASEGSLVQQKA